LSRAGCRPRVAVVVAIKHTTETVVRHALSRAKAASPAGRAELIWQHDGDDWVLVYDVALDPRYAAGDQQRDQRGSRDGAIRRPAAQLDRVSGSVGLPFVRRHFRRQALCRASGVGGCIVHS